MLGGLGFEFYVCHLCDYFDGIIFIICLIMMNGSKFLGV